MNAIKRSLLSLFACALLSPGAAAQKPAAQGGKPPADRFVSEGGHFRCSLPKGWTKVSSAGQSEADKKVYGADVTGPAGPGGLAPSISVKYYAKGNALFRSADEFLRVHSRAIPGLGMEGEEYSAVTETRLAGLPAKKFDRKKQVFTGGKTMENKPVLSFERYLVVQAAGGFYVLSYFSAHSSARANLPAFEKVAASFETLKPR